MKDDDDLPTALLLFVLFTSPLWLNLGLQLIQLWSEQ